MISKIIADYDIDEIDYVFDYKDYLAGDKKRSLVNCEQNYQLCKEHGVKFKVILETGALPSISSIYQLSREVIETGCDFIKTSTGKIKTGATPEATFAMLMAIKDSETDCGLKISGGVRKKSQALEYINLAEKVLNRRVNNQWFRIGASSLIDELLDN
jgi:deoxyribose-phosphate aldolase